MSEDAADALTAKAPDDGSFLKVNHARLGILCDDPLLQNLKNLIYHCNKSYLNSIILWLNISHYLVLPRPFLEKHHDLNQCGPCLIVACR